MIVYQRLLNESRDKKICLHGKENLRTLAPISVTSLRSRKPTYIKWSWDISSTRTRFQTTCGWLMDTLYCSYRYVTVDEECSYKKKIK